MALSEADIQHDLDRRKPGKSRHTTQRRKPDAVQILSGVFEGQTTGAPIGLLIQNVDQRSKDSTRILVPVGQNILRAAGLRSPPNTGAG